MLARNHGFSMIPRRQLGALYAREARDMYPDRDWAQVEPLIHRLWEREHPGDWPRSREMIRRFWHEG